MMAAVDESERVSEGDARISPRNGAPSFRDLSSISEPLTPVDVIVQRQIRDVFQLQNEAVSRLQESFDGQGSFMRDHLVPKEEHLSKMKMLEESVKENFVSREEYENMLLELEQEQRHHAETKVRLMEATDKLDFTLREVEVLKTQLDKEKEAFQQIVDSLRSQVAKGSNWNKELESKYSVSQNQCQDLKGRLASREATIETLEQRLSAQQMQCERKIEEIQVERQQDQYVARMLEQQNNRQTKKTVKKMSSGHKVKR